MGPPKIVRGCKIQAGCEMCLIKTGDGEIYGNLQSDSQRKTHSNTDEREMERADQTQHSGKKTCVGSLIQQEEG